MKVGFLAGVESIVNAIERLGKEGEVPATISE